MKQLLKRLTYANVVSSIALFLVLGGAAANGQSFTAYVALASEKDSNTCWYWLNAQIIS